MPRIKMTAMKSRSTKTILPAQGLKQKSNQIIRRPGDIKPAMIFTKDRRPQNIKPATSAAQTKSKNPRNIMPSRRFEEKSETSSESVSQNSSKKEETRQKPIKSRQRQKSKSISPSYNNTSRRGRLQTITQKSHRRMVKQSLRFSRFSIPRVVFQKVVRSIATDYIPDCKFQSEALFALQTACEDFLTGLFSDALMCTMHAKRKTLMIQDVNLVKRLRGMDYAPI